MYVYVNMGSVSQFDPTPAVNYWLSMKNRRPKSSDTWREQEWFFGVFEEAESGRKRKSQTKLQF